MNVELFDQSYAINEFKGINQDDYKITIGSDKVVSGDDLGIQISAIGLSNAEVGKYELVAVSDNPNYKVNVIGATLFIKESTQPSFIAFIIIASILTFTIICSISIYFVNKRRSYRWKDVD